MRCRSHDPTRLSHRLLLPTDVSPVDAITAFGGKEDRPDCGRQKGISHRRFVVASPSLRCHGADVSRAWFFAPQPEEDKDDQTSRLIPW